MSLDWGDGNIERDPLFVGEGDFHLTADSPCIDAGIDVGVYTDIDGDVRPYGAGFDIGADEYISENTLVLDASYAEGTISLDYFIGMFEPATWANYLIATVPAIQVFPLWTVELPPVDPPVYFPVGFYLPSMGVVGIWSGLLTEEGLQLKALDWVDTGS